MHLVHKECLVIIVIIQKKKKHINIITYHSSNVYVLLLLWINCISMQKRCTYFIFVEFILWWYNVYVLCIHSISIRFLPVLPIWYFILNVFRSISKLIQNECSTVDVDISANDLCKIWVDVYSLKLTKHIIWYKKNFLLINKCLHKYNNDMW